MQHGHIFQQHGSWHLRYRIAGKQACQRLAPYNDQYRTKKSVRHLADEILRPINQGQQTSGPQTLQRFIESSYLPHAKLHKRSSTFKGYKNLYRRHVAPHVGGIRVSSFITFGTIRRLPSGPFGAVSKFLEENKAEGKLKLKEK